MTNPQKLVLSKSVAGKGDGIADIRGDGNQGLWFKSLQWFYGG